MTNINKNQTAIGRFAFLYEFKFHIKFTDRTVFISAYKHHIIKVQDNEIITHADCRTNNFVLDDLVLTEDNDFTSMRLLVNQLIEQNFNKKKFQCKLYLLSNKQKLETCKYVFVLKDFASRKLQEIRDNVP